MNYKLPLDFNQMLTIIPLSFDIVKCSLVGMFILIKDESNTLILTF